MRSWLIYFFAFACALRTGWAGVSGPLASPEDQEPDTLWGRVWPVALFPEALDGRLDDIRGELERGCPANEAVEALVGEVDRVRLKDVGGRVGRDRKGARYRGVRVGEQR